MKHLFLVLAVLSGFVACERHSWDETRKLHLHEAHDDGYKEDAAHVESGSQEDEPPSEGGAESH